MDCDACGEMRTKDPMYVYCGTYGYIALCKHDCSHFCILHPGAVHQCHYL